MILGQLYEMYQAGALNIKYEEGSSIAILGNMQITLEQAHNICAGLGWESYVLSPFEIIDKTAKFVRGVKSNLTNEYIVANTVVTFKNVRSSVYGKTHDRIHLACGSSFELSIIYNMPGNSSKYVIYDSFTSTPVAKGRNLKQVAEYLNTR